MSRKKQTFIFFVVIVSLSLLMIAFGLIGQSKKKGNQVRIYVDGILVQEVSLNMEDEILIHGNPGDNVLVIRDGKAYIKEASCKNHICMEQGEISRDGETIICLPNQIVVEVSAQEHEVDVVVR